MTETVRTALVSFIACSVVGGMLEYLAPPKYRKTLRVCVVGVVLAFCVAPVFEADFSLRVDYSTAVDKEQLEYDSLMHTANLVEKKVRAEVKTVLINEGVDEYEIYITTSVDKEDGAVFLEEVVIEVHEKYEDKLSVISENISADYRSVVKTGVKNE